MTPEAKALLILIEVQRTMLRAEYKLLPGTIEELAMRRLDEAEQLLNTGDTQ